MRRKSILLSIIIFSLIISGCGNEHKAPVIEIESETSSEENILQTGADSEGSDEVIGNNPNTYEILDATSLVYMPTAENLVLQYDGEYLEESLIVCAGTNTCEFTPMVYVDGIRVPYRYNDEVEFKDYHVIHTDDIITNPMDSSDTQYGKQLKIYFKPQYGTKGEKSDFRIIIMDNPTYKVPDTSIEARELWPLNSGISVTQTMRDKVIEYNEETNLPDCSNNYETEVLTEAMEKYFEKDEGGNNLDDEGYLCTQFYEKTLNGDEDQFPGVAYFSVNKNDNLEFYIPFIGNGGHCRASIYINNEIVPCFDGKEYLDVNVERNQFAYKKVSIPMKDYEGINRISMMVFNDVTKSVRRDENYILEVK